MEEKERKIAEEEMKKLVKEILKKGDVKKFIKQKLLFLFLNLTII